MRGAPVGNGKGTVLHGGRGNKRPVRRGRSALLRRNGEKGKKRLTKSLKDSVFRMTFRLADDMGIPCGEPAAQDWICLFLEYGVPVRGRKPSAVGVPCGNAAGTGCALPKEQGTDTPARKEACSVLPGSVMPFFPWIVPDSIRCCRR